MWRHYYQEEIEKKIEYINDIIDLLKNLSKFSTFVQSRNFTELSKLSKRINIKKRLSNYEKSLLEAKKMC